MRAFESLPALVDRSSFAVAEDEELKGDAPDEYMEDPVLLPSGNAVDRSTIVQHLLNDSTDPFNREEMTMDDVKPATDLKRRMDQWLEEKREARRINRQSPS